MNNVNFAADSLPGGGCAGPGADSPAGSCGSRFRGLRPYLFINPVLLPNHCAPGAPGAEKIVAMKKFFLFVCIALAGLCATAQEKGDMAVGVNLGVAPSLESDLKATNFGIGAKFQYNVTDPIRVEADVDYWFKSKGVSVFEISANVHYLFSVMDNLKVYPLAGIGYGNISMDAMDVVDLGPMASVIQAYMPQVDTSESASRFLFNVGVGGEYSVTENIAVGLEIKYQYMKDFNRLPIKLGVTYKF